MEIKQFYDKALAHGSYVIINDGKAAIIDPGRDPQPYLDFIREHDAQIVAVLETHPHADFVSSHRELHEQHGATIYTNSKAGAEYPHQPLDDGDEIYLGKATLWALFTPGHSPDHNSYLLMDEDAEPHSIYTGDALFVGDVGRPDLREGTGHIRTTREELALQMFRTVQEVFKHMEDHVIVYPAHGAGSLCGKNMGPETSSTIGHEKQHNWAFREKNEAQFVSTLLDNPPFIPQYFPYDVELNRMGAVALNESLSRIPKLTFDEMLSGLPVVDVRAQELFKQGHRPGAINIQEQGKFETWLGALVAPETPFYLIVEDEAQRERVVRRVAKIGYETFVRGTVIASSTEAVASPQLDLNHFKQHPEAYSIVDVRNAPETQDHELFAGAVNIPLAELPRRVSEVNTDRPVVVHCAGGYRSAAGASILEGSLPEVEVYDLGEAINQF